MVSETFATRLERLMAERDIGAQPLAKAAGLHKDAVRKAIDRNSPRMSYEATVNLARALNVHPDYLACLTDYLLPFREFPKGAMITPDILRRVVTRVLRRDRQTDRRLDPEGLADIIVTASEVAAEGAEEDVSLKSE